MKFVLTKTLKLDKHGKDWSDCYVTFTAPDMDAVQKMSNMEESVDSFKTITNVLKKHFVDGKGFNGTKVVKMEAEDLSGLPVPIFQDCVDFFMQLLRVRGRQQKSTK